MEQHVKKIALYSFLTLIMVVIIGVVVFTKSDGQQPLGGQVYAPVNVVGSRIGTSTTAVQFTNNSATTTYITYIGDEVDQLIYTILVKTASTTAQGPNARFSVLASNDNYCNTASTSSDTLNAVLMRDINWYDTGDNLLNKTHNTTFNGTSTIPIVIPTAGTGQKIILDELNAKCLALQVSASGTSLMVQATAKQHN